MQTERTVQQSKVFWVLVIGVLSFWGAGFPIEALGQSADTYTVQPGDTCLGIIKKLGGRVTLAELHELNPEVYHGPPPHHLEPGTVLRLTRGPVKPDAHLTFVKPLVETRKPDSPFWHPGSVGLDLYRRYRVATRSGATTEVTFRDASEVQLHEESLLVIYGASASRSKHETHARVELVEGSLRGGLAELRGESALDVKTPAAKVSAKSREVQVEVDRSKTTRLSVYDGEADIAARGVKVRVPKGNGTVTRMGKAPEPPAPLPPPPQWTKSAGVTAVLIDQAMASVVLEWDPVSQARAYEVEVARDEAFRDIVVHKKVQAPEHAVTVERVEPGRYVARVSARDRRGLLGEASLPHGLAVIGVTTHGCRRADGGLEADWAARLTFSYRKVPVEVTVDGARVHPGHVDMVGPGTRSVEVRVKEDGFESVTFPVIVRNVDLGARVSAQTLPAEGGQVAVTLTGTSGEGQLVPLQPGWVRILPSPTKLQADAAGHLVVIVDIGPTDEARTIPILVYLGPGESPRVSLSLAQDGPPPLPGRVGGAVRGGLDVPFGDESPGWLGALEVSWLPSAVTQHLVLSAEANLVQALAPDSGETRRTMAVGLHGTWRTRLVRGVFGFAGAGYLLQSGLGDNGSGTGFGLEAILGAGHPLGSGEVFLDCRYHYVPEADTNSGALPGSVRLSLGFRWMGLGARGDSR